MKGHKEAKKREREKREKDYSGTVKIRMVFCVTNTLFPALDGHHCHASLDQTHLTSLIHSPKDPARGSCVRPTPLDAHVVEDQV